ncbi:UNVERIFIED_CONTAM: Eukaryotic translation initiation factor 4G [Sesamum radiatum]|uniref:Eukaryotic translation initiation factor 4G n=1 Tax=Sesamum radiatum TaxID=300843 RepID=A0AAW2VK32_SESRA
MSKRSLDKVTINLTKARHGLISEDQLIKGFESVLAVLEDAVNDAPRAQSSLAVFFAKVVMEMSFHFLKLGD